MPRVSALTHTSSHPHVPCAHAEARRHEPGPALHGPRLLLPRPMRDGRGGDRGPRSASPGTWRQKGEQVHGEGRCWPGASAGGSSRAIHCRNRPNRSLVPITGADTYAAPLWTPDTQQTQGSTRAHIWGLTQRPAPRHAGPTETRHSQPRTKHVHCTHRHHQLGGPNQ